MTQSKLEREFILEWNRRYPTAVPITEYKFSPSRNWRFDFAWPSNKVALEIHGYGPGHYSVKGMTDDFDKQHQALLLNWTVVYFTSAHLKPKRIQEALGTLGQLLGIPPQKLTYEELRRKRQ